MRTLLLYLNIEFQKTKRRGIWLVLSALWLVQIAYMNWGLCGNNMHENGWMDALYSMPVLNAIMLPTVFAVLASRIIDCEHKENTWKLLETMQSKKSLFFAKALTGLFYILVFSVFQLLAILFTGFSHGFGGTFQIWSFGYYFLQTVSVSFILYLIQMLLAMLFQNQAVSLSIGLCGSLTGLFILFLPPSLLYEIIPWGLYGATMIVGMDWDPVTRYTAFSFIKPVDHAFLFVVLWLTLLLIGGWKLFEIRPAEGFSFPALFEKKTERKKITLSLLPTEYIKLKRTPIWLAFIILPMISAFIGTFNYMGNIMILKDLWYDLWSQHTLFLCYFFMPALLGVYCSYLWRMEHTGTNWNQLLVHIAPWKLVRNKLFAAAFVLFLSLLWIAALYLICGRFAGFTDAIPHELVKWLLCGFAGGISICCLQLFLSLIIRSFAVPIGIALAGSIAGLALSSKGLWYLLPYSLLSIGMGANNPFYDLNYGMFFTACTGFSTVFFLLSTLYIKYTDVKTQG